VSAWHVERVVSCRVELVEFQRRHDTTRFVLCQFGETEFGFNVAIFVYIYSRSEPRPCHRPASPW